MEVVGLIPFHLQHVSFPQQMQLENLIFLQILGTAPIYALPYDAFIHTLDVQQPADSALVLVYEHIVIQFKNITYIIY